MAYDSTTATALALRAYQRAQATTDANRRNMLQNYGLNADGSLDPTNTIGSIYQTNLGSAQQEQQARMLDRRRGFAGVGGLGQHSTAQAHANSLVKQAGVTQAATQDLAGNTLEGEQYGQQYQDQLSQISSNKQLDDAETARQNQILQSQQEAMAALARSMVPPSAPQPAAVVTPAQLKKNPRAGQTARNAY